jgi:hypothetical protein
LTNPDAPVNFIEVYADRTAHSLGLTWTLAAFNGGTPVIDYTISVAKNFGTVQVLKSGNLATNYVASSLEAGATYDFWVQSRNSFGLSTYSAQLQLVAGFKPEIPAPPTTTVIANNVIIKWVAPTTNGATITSYRISIMQKDGSFSEDLDDCNGMDSDFVTAL